jgi:hypothetical protein
MIDEILDGVIKESRELLKDIGGTVILKTNYKSTNLPSYSMPLLLLDLVDGGDTGQYAGGTTHTDWLFAFNSYNYEPDSYTDDATGYSTGLLKVIDDIRQHFSKGNWLTQGMIDVLNNYCFKYTLSGILPADAIDQDGLVMGYRIVFDSIAIDNSTNAVQISKSVLQYVEQIGYPPSA